MLKILNYKDMFSAKIIADSVNPFGNRLTTMVVTFPRIILAELNTHRMFSRNSASSRAIPFKKMVEAVQNNPFIPIAWQKEHKGMQGVEYITDETDLKLNIGGWLRARDNAVSNAEYLNHGVIEGRDNGVTKQLCNRLLEPFMWHTVLITATEWENFFYLRCPKYSIFSENIPLEFRSKKDLLKYVKQVEAPEFKDQYDNLTDLQWLEYNKGQAEIHMMALAEAMWDAYNESTPKQLKAGEWHIPFGDTLIDHIEEDGLHTDSKIDIAGNWLGLFPDIDNLDEIPKDKQYDEWLIIQKIKIATARCARVSYTVVGEEGKPDNYENDIKLHDRLAASGHASPFEHIAQCMSIEEYEESTLYNLDGTETKGVSRNFRGFKQYRELMKL